MSDGVKWRSFLFIFYINVLDEKWRSNPIEYNVCM